ncbi:Uncharacterised protein [uncultured archaeon]|nr:Uncharacterised protein [uncultured archaeon]
MISALASGFTGMARKPLTLVPALLGTIAGTAILLLSLDSFTNVFFSSLLFGEVPDVAFFELPFQFANSYGPDLLVIFMALLASLTVSAATAFAYAIMARDKKAGAMKAMATAAKMLPSAFALALVSMAGLLIYSAVAFCLFAAGISLEGIGFIAFAFFLAWLGFGAFVLIKLAFTPIALATGNLPLKKALSESWNKTSGKSMSTVLFLVLAWVISGIVSGIFFGLGDLVQQEELSFLIVLTGICASSAYFNIAFARFYIDSLG